MRGGPIIAVQVENEYGAYAKDDLYMAFIKEVAGHCGSVLLNATPRHKILLHEGGRPLTSLHNHQEVLE